MKFKLTEFPGLVEILPKIYHDERGSFHEAYSSSEFYDHGVPSKYVQDNESFSKKGTLRGLHFQNPPHDQGKLVRVTLGRVLDVIVDLREESPTYLKTFSVILDSNQKNMLFVPRGFAHGFLALSDCIFHYKCTNFYRKDYESGIRWDDETLNIDWYGDVPKTVSKKDQQLPLLQETLANLKEQPYKFKFVS